MRYTNTHYRKHLLIAFIIMAMSLPLSIFMMSVMQFIILGLWLFNPLENNIRNLKTFLSAPFRNLHSYFKMILRNKIALVLLSIVLLHLLGLIYTKDFQGAYKDFKDKIPIVVFILVLSTLKPFSDRQLYLILHFYIFAVLIASFWGFYKFIYVDFSDIRDISPFINPIRFGMNICLAILIQFYFITKNFWNSRMLIYLYSLTIIWFISFLYIMESGNGLFILALLLFILIIRKSLSFSIWLRIPIYISFLLIIVLGIHWFMNTANYFLRKPEVNFSKLPTLTKHSNFYLHDTLHYTFENGKYIGLYIAEKELRPAWEKRSQLAFNGKDKQGQELKVTLYRFLTSKGLRKDADGLKSLTDKEIKAIENGIANHIYLTNPGIKSRFYKFLFAYQHYLRDGSIAGNSSLQRLEYWKTAFQIIHKNKLIGVGTGDTYIAFEEQYLKNKSKLPTDKRYPAHNQYLSVLVSFGVIGFLWYYLTYLYPLRYKHIRKNYFFSMFTFIILISMLTGDTTEMYDSIVFFAFFNSLFLFGQSFSNTSLPLSKQIFVS